MTVYLMATVSADGLTAPLGGGNPYTWTSTAERSWFDQRSREIGTVILNKTRYESLPRPLSDRLAIVYDSDEPEGTIPDYDPNRAAQVVYTQKNAETLIAELDEKEYAEVIVYVNQSLTTEFINERLVNILYLVIEPRVFGRGSRLFTDRVTRSIALSSVRQIGSGAVLLTYSVT